ncbi:MAG: TIR domain-containing protein [Caulobacterales bacterium]
MADLVISHTTEDRDRAEVIARALSAQGLKVWMYRDILGQGGDRDEVTAKIRDATRVIAVWSPASCASPWVLEEARAAARDHRLINVELVSGMTPRAFQSGLRIDLSMWGGTRADPILDPFAQAIATIVAKEPKQAEKKPLFGFLNKSEPKPRRASTAPKTEPDDMFGPAPVVAAPAIIASPPPMPEADPQPVNVAPLPVAAKRVEAAPPQTAAPAPVSEPPLKIEVFETTKAKTPEPRGARSNRRRREISWHRAFAFGLGLSVLFGIVFLAVRHYFNSLPLTVAARSTEAAPQPAAPAPLQPAPSGYSAEPPVLQFVKELDTKSTSLAAVDFGSDEWLLVIANSAGTVRGYEATSGKFFQQYQSGQKPLTDVKLDGGARQMAAASTDGSVYVWRLADASRQRITIGKSPVRKVAWKPDDILLASGNDDGVLDVRSPIEGTPPVRRTFDSPITAIAWRPDGFAIAVGLKSGGISFIDPATGKVLYTAYGHTGAVNALAFSPNTTTLASTGEDGVTKLWSAFDGIGMQNIPTRPCTQAELNKEGKCPNLDLVYNPDGTILLVSTQKGEVEGYKVKTGERAFLLRGHQAPVTGLAWSYHDHRIASVDSTGKAVYWTSPSEKH